MKKAFSLVELLVVIGIIGILAGVLLASFSGGSESAKATRCLTNLKTLANACHSRGMAAGNYPLAGSVEHSGAGTDSDGKMKRSYHETPGWISWYSKGAYGENNSADSHASSGSFFTSAYCQERETREYCLTNGVLWNFVSGDGDVFVCPSHRKAARTMPPAWSYVMNGAFGYDRTLGSGPTLDGYGKRYGHVDRLDRLLLFAELQFLKNDKLDSSFDPGAGIAHDCTLQYEKGEVVGVNHPAGNKGLCAHIVYADGHVEKLTVPATKKSSASWSLDMSKGDLERLTEWLCKAKDVSFDGRKYEEVD